LGTIEAGVRETLRREGIENPSTAYELLAIFHAKRLDNIADEKNQAGISREMRLCLEEIRHQPKQTNDPVGALASRY
jgi:hypothetical protein